MAAEYGNYATPKHRDVPAKRAADKNGNDVTRTLAAVDGVNLVLPVVGDWAVVTFAVPTQMPGKERTLFLRANGYYLIHLPENQPRQLETQARIGMVPGAIVEYSLVKWEKWLADQRDAQ